MQREEEFTPLVLEYALIVGIGHRSVGDSWSGSCSHHRDHGPGTRASKGSLDRVAGGRYSDGRDRVGGEARHTRHVEVGRGANICLHGVWIYQKSAHDGGGCWVGLSLPDGLVLDALDLKHVLLVFSENPVDQLLAASIVDLFHHVVFPEQLDSDQEVL